MNKKTNLTKNSRSHLHCAERVFALLDARDAIAVHRAEVHLDRCRFEDILAPRGRRVERHEALHRTGRVREGNFARVQTWLSLHAVVPTYSTKRNAMPAEIQKIRQQIEIESMGPEASSPRASSICIAHGGRTTRYMAAGGARMK
eukprot:639048-Rhodomonas_salina.1